MKMSWALVLAASVGFGAPGLAGAATGRAYRWSQIKSVSTRIIIMVWAARTLAA